MSATAQNWDKKSMKVVIFSLVCTIDFFFFFGKKFSLQFIGKQHIRFVGNFCLESVDCAGTRNTMHHQETSDLLVMERDIIGQAKSNFVLLSA